MTFFVYFCLLLGILILERALLLFSIPLLIITVFNLGFYFVYIVYLTYKNIKINLFCFIIHNYHKINYIYLICLYVGLTIYLLYSISPALSEDYFTVSMNKIPWYSNIVNLDSSGNIIGATSGGPGGGGGGPNTPIVPVPDSQHHNAQEEGINSSTAVASSEQHETIEVKYNPGRRVEVQDREYTSQERSIIVDRLKDASIEGKRKTIAYPTIKQANLEPQDLYCIRKDCTKDLTERGIDANKYSNGIFRPSAGLDRVNSLGIITYLKFIGRS